MAVAIMASARGLSSTYCVISTRKPPAIAVRPRRAVELCRKRLTASILSSSLRGTLVRSSRIVQVRGRLRGFEPRAEIKKRSEESEDEFRLSLSDAKTPLGELSQYTVSLPLGLATFEGLFLAGWIASLRGLLPGSLPFFGVADIILSGVMFANCVGGWYALERSRIEIDALKLSRNRKPFAPGWIDVGISLAVSFIPFANLFLWLRLASKQQDVPADAKAALVANALIYEAPRLFALLFLFRGGLFALLQVGFVSNLAFLLSAVHRPFAEARVKNEKVLVEAARAQKIKELSQKPKKVITPEERERIARQQEFEEFDLLLSQRSSSSPGTAVLPAKPKDWSVGETMEWLGQQGLARYATSFAENNVDGELLLQLTNDDLRDELQILSFGDRRKLELLIQQLKRSA